MSPITDLPEVIDPETGATVQPLRFTRSVDGEWIDWAHRERAEGFEAVAFPDGREWSAENGWTGGAA
jgi:hypothetical protein